MTARQLGGAVQVLKQNMDEPTAVPRAKLRAVGWGGAGPNPTLQ